MRARRGRGSQVYAITSVQRALSEDVHDRMVRYLVSMGIRTGCFLLIIVVPGAWKWVCVAGALILPALAVLVANAGRERPTGAPALHDGATAAALPPERQLPYDPKTEYLR
ncbi:DUF3099 domain-containing protein [Georgenia sp. TF02-10]|uniref:DUF3099 domain-containing protein n=1 Tax=Georgenia sp. TF02-10 TaxID=2917725 RepID=UPI001FA7CA78|nr:DUF3099 domain-containing protein [Georgenia sp. TF02-10]UNX56057.1 DUF3099 domain-containing protein [Georgenia sp. TF02-10]